MIFKKASRRLRPRSVLRQGSVKTMIRINLLPDREKESKRIEKTIGNIARTGLSVVFSLVALFAYMLAIQVVLGIELSSARFESAAHSEKTANEMKETEEMLKNVNAATQKVNRTSKEMPCWSKVLKHLSDICPDGVRLDSAHIEKEFVRIQGFSKTRESFLQFQEELKKEGFTNIVSPVSNVVSPKDFEFTVEADVEKKYLNEI
jgi:Tfp pilus assembly protein PilN